MATDFWASSHYKRWIVDRATLNQARAEDLLYIEDPEYLHFLGIFFANVITKLAKKLQLRQRVIATAIVFFRRFYLKNSYCETDPFIVIAACCYVAAKAEESPVHIKNVITEARLLFANDEYGVKSFPTDNSKLAEMEFYLVDDLECDLIVFHPYRTLMTLCGKEGATNLSETEVGEMGAGVHDGPRYWGTGEGKLLLQEGALQMAWFIINDTFCSDLCLIYPPHMIAIAAIYLTLVLHSSTRANLTLPGGPETRSQSQQMLSGTANIPARRSSRSSNNVLKKSQPQDVIGFMAGLNVNMSVVASIAQEIISLYTLWEKYKEEPGDGSAKGSGVSGQTKRTASGMVRAGAVLSGGMVSSNASTLSAVDDFGGTQPVLLRAGAAQTSQVTPAFLAQLLLRMREGKMADIAHPASGRPVVYDKRLERTQAAG